MQTKKMTVVTGCDTGIGYGLVDALLAEGYTVLASYLHEPLHRPHENLICWKLDLRKSGDIASFAELAAKMTTRGARLDALVHNAGMVLAAPIEDMPMDGLHEVFEVNFFGLYDLTKRLIPTLIENRSRVVINVSLAGRVSLPFFSPYSASKFALEGFADSLRQELAPFGARVSVLETGSVATPIWDKSWERIKSEILPSIGDRWSDTFRRTAESFVAGGNAGLSVERAVKSIVGIIEARRPKVRYFLSKTPIADRLKILLPYRLRDRLVADLFGLRMLG